MTGRDRNRRQQNLRRVVLTIGGAIVVALAVWIGVRLVIEDEPPPQTAPTTDGAQTPEEAVAAYVDLLAADQYESTSGLFANPTFRIQAEHAWWYDLGSMADIAVTPGTTVAFAEEATTSLGITVRFTTGDEWSYTSTVPLIKDEGHWLVEWEPAVLHPSLQRGESVRAALTWPHRGRILADDGTPLTEDRPAVTVGVVPERIETMAEVTAALQEQLGVDPNTVEAAVEAPGVQPDWFLPMTLVRPLEFRDVKPQLAPVPGIVFRETPSRLSPAPGFAAHVLGRVGEITAEELDGLGPPYEQGDSVGLSGLERAFEQRLAGSPSVEVSRTAQNGDVIDVLYRAPGRDAEDLHTTLDPAVQRAVERVLDAAPEPSAIVVLDAASGEIRGVGSRPLGEFNRAFGARYPPGSTFKIVTAAALQGAGLDADAAVACPGQIDVGGGPINNAGGTALGQTSLSEAFAFSCNTTFAPLGADLPAAELVAAAEQFGFNRSYDLPLPVAGGQFPAPESAREQGAASIGQARVLASPLHMATVAAAVASGEWRTPRLLTETAADSLPVAFDTTPLREMMRAVVDHGTGAAADLDGEPVFGKTGSAEFGEEDPLPTHAWFVGYRGPLAFAVFVEGGGSGGGVAAPLAADLLEVIDEEIAAAGAPLAPCTEGGWATFQGTNERSGCSAVETIAGLEIAWATPIGIQGWLNNPVISGDMVFTGSAGRTRGAPDPADGVYAVDLQRGGVVWTRPANNDVNGVAIANGIVVATGDEGLVWALDAADGSMTWAYPANEAEIDAPFFTNPLVVEDIVVVGDATGILHALDLATGAVRWTAQLDTSIRGGAASDGEAIYVVGEAGDARAFGLDGREFWQQDLTFENHESTTLTARVFATPTVVGDLVVISYIRDTGYPAPAMIALNRFVGSVAWEASDPDTIRGEWGNLRGSPAVAGDLLVLSDPLFEGLVAVDATDGTAQWAIPGGAICIDHWASPAVAGSAAVVPLHGGLYVFDIDSRVLADGVFLGVEDREGSFPSGPPCATDTPILASPAIGDGFIVVGTEEGVLFRVD